MRWRLLEIARRQVSSCFFFFFYFRCPSAFFTAHSRARRFRVFLRLGGRAACIEGFIVAGVQGVSREFYARNDGWTSISEGELWN